MDRGRICCCVLGEKQRVSPPSWGGLTFCPARVQQAHYLYLSDSVVITGGSGPNCCSSSPCEPRPRRNRALSHRAGWQRPLWLHSICRHSSGPFHLLLISLPPLHFAKLSQNFVSAFMPRLLLLFLTSPVAAVIQASPRCTE